MTREELLKKIDFEKNWLYECGIFGSDVDIAFHAIKNKVIEALEQETKWIPVSERLPEDGGDYLVTIVFDIGGKEPVREVRKDYFCNLSKKWLYEEKNVVAWMPKPEPYKAESEEE